MCSWIYLWSVFAGLFQRNWWIHSFSTQLEWVNFPVRSKLSGGEENQSSYLPDNKMLLLRAVSGVLILRACNSFSLFFSPVYSALPFSKCLVSYFCRFSFSKTSWFLKGQEWPYDQRLSLLLTEIHKWALFSRNQDFGPTQVAMKRPDDSAKPGSLWSLSWEVKGRNIPCVAIIRAGKELLQTGEELNRFLGAPCL